MNFHRWIATAMITLCTLTSAGCDDDVTAPAEPMIGSVVLQLEADSLSVGETTQLHVTILSVHGDTLSPEGVTILSSDADIVTVSETGLVMAEGSGTATVTVTVGVLTARVTVYVRRASFIEVTPADTTLVLDDTLRLSATVLDATGNPVPDAVVRWIGDFDGLILDIFDDEGLTGGAVAVSVGSGSISAITEGLLFTVDVRVEPSEVGSIVLSPDSLTVAVGDTTRLNVVVRDTTGAVIPDPRLVWHCGFGNPGQCLTGNDFLIATIDPSGLVTGGPGGGGLTVGVVARSRGVNSNEIRLTVVDSLVDSGAGSWDY